ncbi:MAG: NADPH:quinone reductase [Acidimicrobiaceae bacterium]
MKAAVYDHTGGPEVLRYDDVADPVCHPRGVVIEVKAVSIEGGDVLNRAGGALTSHPHIVGYQCAGAIREVGPEVTDLHEGQSVVAVMGSGSHAQLVGVPAAACWVVPDGLPLEEAACVPVPFGTADDCLFEFGRLQEGETALIQAGAGGVGIAAIQLAKRAGATVIATASQDDKLRRLADLGVDHGINYATSDFVAEVRRLTDGRGVDVVVDPVGGTVLAGSLKCLGYRGRCMTVGNAGRESGERQDVQSLMGGNQSLTGVFLGAEMRTERVQRMIARHLDDIVAGRLKVIVDRSFPLSEAAAAHAYVESRQAFGRVLLIP